MCRIMFKALVWKQLFFFVCIIAGVWMVMKSTVQKSPKNLFLKSFWKSNCPEVHCGNSGQLFPVNWLGINIPHTRFDQTGHPTRLWECQGQESFGCLGEWNKSEFPGRGRGYIPPSSVASSGGLYKHDIVYIWKATKTGRLLLA